MANVGFKLGLQKDLDTLLSAGTNAGAAHGSFYLTSDTHRLYIGNSDGSLSAVNEGVTTVATLGQLPNTKDNPLAYVGRFYYVTGSNILCVFNGKSWAQINTDTYVYQTDLALTQVTANREVTVTQTIDNTNDGSNTSSSADDVWSVKGGHGIYVKAEKDANDNPQLVIEGDKYTVSTETNGTGVKLKLDSEKEESDSSFSFLPTNAVGEPTDETNIRLERNSNGDILIGAKDTKNKEFNLEALAEGGFKITIVDSHNGEVELLDADQKPLNPVIKYGKKVEEVVFKDGVATLDVYSKDDINETLRVLNAMTYRGTIGAKGTAATKITMNSSTDPNAGCKVIQGTNTQVKVSIGDMFLCCGNKDVSYNGIQLSTNTLLIARSTDGTEDTQGYIEDSKLIFDIVASTVDIDTTYRFESENVGSNNSGAKITLVASTEQDAGSLTIKTTRSEGKNTGLKITRTSTDAPTGDQDTWLIEHDATSKTVSENNAYSYQNSDTLINSLENRKYTAKVVTGIETNDSGHVTGVTMHEMPIIDSSSQIDTIDESADAFDANNKSYGFHKSTTTELLVTGNTKTTEDSFAFVSETLKIKTSGEVNTPAGYAQSKAYGLQIDLIWGTF